MTFDNSLGLKILHWNANGISTFSNLMQFECLLERENIHIASLNETHLKENHKTYFKNYRIYRNDRHDTRGGGVALVVHRSVKHKLLPIVNTLKLENISIEILVNKRAVVISSAYSPKYASSFADDILKMTALHKDFIILGDFNAKHNSWNCVKNNTAGNVLFNLQQKHNFFIFHPNSPTFYPYQRNRNESVIDLVLSNTTLNINLNVLEYDIPSDHRPVVCTIENSSVYETEKNYFNYKLTDWEAFRSMIAMRIVLHTHLYTSTSAIDREIKKFILMILTTRNICTPNFSHSCKTFLPANIVKLIRTRKKFKRKSQRTAIISEANFYEQCVKLLTIMINNKIKSLRNGKWNKLLKSLRPGDKSFWKISRSLRGKRNRNIPYFLQGNRKIVTDNEKAEQLSITFSASNNLTCTYKHSIDKVVNSEVDRFKRAEVDSHVVPSTSLNELNFLIASLRATKSPGLDDVSNVLIKNLPPKAVQLLVIIFNSCLKVNYFPKHFKKAKVIAILKPNKPKYDPSSYRPISLLSNLGKLLEKIIQKRLCDFTENTSIIASEQFGFKKQHSAVHQVSRITNIVKGNKVRKLSTGMIVLDIEKAFDTVWHNGLIYKLLKANIPKYLCKLIANFLADRTFVVAVNDTISSPKPVLTGLPQGSILSPILYSIYTSDFSPPSYVKTAYYADDTAIITSSKLTKALLKKMERSFAACRKYFYKWKIKINPNKTQTIIFPYNNSPKRLPNRALNFENESLSIQNDVKYLGVCLDKKLNFAKHIEETCKKSLRTIRALWPILSKRSTLNIHNKNLIYKCVIRPTLTYGSPIWYKAAKTHRKKLQIIQNKCLKIINKKHWRYSTQLLHSETGYERIDDFVKKLNNKYYENIENSSYQMIKECRESAGVQL